MVSIALGLFILCVIYVAAWSVMNDGARSIDDQKGFIKMRVPAKAPSAKGKGAMSLKPAATTRSRLAEQRAQESPEGDSGPLSGQGPG
jgi:hypothetical protein